MKLPSSLIRGLTEEQQEQLSGELKNSRLSKQLRAWLEAEIASTEIREEDLDLRSVGELAKQVGERRGYRRVLKLFPEE